ncbi:MAG TPA: hypothetical protein VMV49_07570 [Candidatus Deferrimicrobium sp.]|nr:hypothetical protein [Candidatus Deferrimicrobium sp.]
MQIQNCLTVLETRQTETLDALLEVLNMLDDATDNPRKKLIKLSPVILASLKERLSDPDAIVRGQTIVILLQLLKYACDSPECFQMEHGPIIDLMLARLNDEAYWVREVSAESLRLWSEHYPRELFQQLTDFVLHHAATLELTDPTVGLAPGDHLVRLLFRIHLTVDVKENFTNFLHDLQEIYTQTHAAPIPRIMNYFSFYIPIPNWAPETEYPDRPRTCWLCTHWHSAHIPLAELQTFFASKKFENRPFELEELKNPADLLDFTTGHFRFEHNGNPYLPFCGYCTQFHTLSCLDNDCSCVASQILSQCNLNGRDPPSGLTETMMLFSPRELKPPIANYFLEVVNFGDRPYFYFWVRLDAIMQEILSKSEVRISNVEDENWDVYKEYIPEKLCPVTLAYQEFFPYSEDGKFTTNINCLVFVDKMGKRRG